MRNAFWVMNVLLILWSKQGFQLSVFYNSFYNNRRCREMFYEPMTKRDYEWRTMCWHDFLSSTGHCLTGPCLFPATWFWRKLLIVCFARCATSTRIIFPYSWDGWVSLLLQCSVNTDCPWLMTAKSRTLVHL